MTRTIFFCAVWATVLCSSAFSAEQRGFTAEEACEQSAPRYGGSTYTFCTGVVGDLTYRWQKYSDKEVGGSVFKIALDPSDPISHHRVPRVSVTCLKDVMDDKRHCRFENENIQEGIIKTFASPVFRMIYYGKGKPAYICVGYSHYPGSHVRIRFDEGKVISSPAREDGCFAAGVTAKLKTSSRVIAQYQEWPYRSWKTAEGDTVGIPEAFDLADFLLTQL